MLAFVVVLHVRSGPRYHSTLGARIVRYGTTTAVVPARHGRLLVVLLHGRSFDTPGAPVVVLPEGGEHRVGGHSAAVWTSAGATAPGAFDDPADYARNDIFEEAPRLNGIPVWLDNGDHDSFLAADAQLARTLHVTQHVWPGGHTRSYREGTSRSTCASTRPRAACA